VVVNRRGYTGSTPFTPEDVAPFNPEISETKSGVPSFSRDVAELYTLFLQQRGAEIARFLQKFIEIEEIPSQTLGGVRAAGGISVMGWSLGNVITLSMLAFANTYDPALTKSLEPYLRKVIIYGSFTYEINILLSITLFVVRSSAPCIGLSDTRRRVQSHFR
jgi:hypothetical protein